MHLPDKPRLDGLGAKWSAYWAADETFDASDPQVANGAKGYQHKHSALSGALADSKMILSSPTGFGHYTLELLLASLSAR